MLFSRESSFGGFVHLGRDDGRADRILSKERKRLRTQFGFPFPSSARAECTGKSDDGRVLFFCFRMPAHDTARLKSKLIESRRPVTQRLVYEDKESLSKIGDIPQRVQCRKLSKRGEQKTVSKAGKPSSTSKIINGFGPDELRVLSYLVMFSRESQGLAYFYLYPTKR
jgi:hypothetical protein